MGNPRFPSAAAAERHLRDLTEALFEVHRGVSPGLHCLVWPGGLDRSLIARLPFAVRTCNAIRQAGLAQGDSPLTVEEVLRIQNFGRKSVDDLVLVLETFLTERIRNGAADTGEGGDSTEPWPYSEHPASSRERETEVSWGQAGKVLASLLASAGELYGTASLASALHPDLVRLASRLGISSDLESLAFDKLVDGSGGLASLAAGRLARVLDALSEAEQTILEHRTLASPGKTLKHIGDLVGVTRERIRQVESRLEGKVRKALGEEFRVFASVLKEQLGHLVGEAELESRLEDVLPSEPVLARRVLRHALLEQMSYTLEDGVYFDGRVDEFLGHLDHFASTVADDVGLVKEQQLLAEIPSPDWHAFWPWLKGRCGFHELFGQLALRASAKARTKAALLSIGRPATRAEIGRLCGFPDARVGGHLSNVPSVAKADKERWGLKDWIDDEYDGIVGEIIQRIEEDGGSTTTERLLHELPTKFNVSPSSVRAYMQTPRFTVQNGRISIANPSMVQLRRLEDVAHGLDGGGDPYWTFAVETRFFRGYSLTGLPVEFAKALGCEPDGSRTVRVVNLPECRDLSLRWPLATTTGASLGYVGDPLRELGIQPGQRARVTIRGPGLVDLAEEPDGDDSPPESVADDLMARIIRRRRAL